MCDQGNFRTSLLVLIALFFSVSSPALAQTTPSETDVELARTHFGTAEAYYERGEYGLALENFQRAFDLSGEPDLLYNISLTHQHLGDSASAADALERYLRTASRVEGRDNLDRRLENLRQRAQQAYAEPPAIETPDVPVASVFLLSAAGLTLAAGAIFAGLAQGEDIALGERCSASAPCDDDDLSTLSTLTLVADIAFATSLATASVGALLLLLDQEPQDTSDFSLGASVGPASASVTLQSSF